MVAKGPVPSHTKKTAQFPNLLTSCSPKEAPVEVWGLREWSQHVANAWFTDDLSTTDGAKANGKWQPIDSGNGMAITEEGITSQCSTVGYKMIN